MIKKVLFFWAILFVLVIFFNEHSGKKMITVKGIENFMSEAMGKSGHYLLFYPADQRVSQEMTLIKEVTKTGKDIQQYKIIDNDFRRMNIQQKPTDFNQLFISFYGEPVVDNFYYTYDIENKQFKKSNLDYFDYEVGVDHMQHFGDDVLFQTIVSHKTGEQNTNFDTGEFNISISNATTQESFETEYGHVPKWTPILSFAGKMIYGVSGRINAKDQYENSGIAIIDLTNETVEYESFATDSIDLAPIYASNEHAYIMGSNGNLYVYDKEFHYTSYSPFENLFKQAEYEVNEAEQLALDDKRILYCLPIDEEGDTLGILSLRKEPMFEPLAEISQPGNTYRLLYQDKGNKEIYIIERNDKEENMIVLDRKNLHIKSKFPVENAHLLDFIIKIN
ncbi:hypothetical protein J14TS2_35600 [Bacillus sp. J14TS2]|uniref:hypothetical protein n=1 Tax=Bacillus sp. J14TS2 TaxID=2807188 RepID=UPI001B1AAF7A|nr:hypothetical protein [Bacillus sp. J14TS2]GIN73085.1 hypothetical protein J14TS2_35600 [Bacillus sp. J14TS2]